MIIVSQNKNNIINFDNTVSIGIEYLGSNTSSKRISAETLGTSVLLGDYKTEERAKEVLREIKGNWEIRRDLAYYMPKE